MEVAALATCEATDDCILLRFKMPLKNCVRVFIAADEAELLDCGGPHSVDDLKGDGVHCGAVS